MLDDRSKVLRLEEWLRSDPDLLPAFINGNKKRIEQALLMKDYKRVLPLYKQYEERIATFCNERRAAVLATREKLCST